MNVLVNLSSCLVSEGINSLLSSAGYQGVAAMQNQPLPDGFIPDVILVDINTINREFFISFPEAKVLLMDTGVGKEKVITALLSFPTHGVLSMGTELRLFKKALEVVNEGQIWVDNSTLKAFLHQGPSIQPAAEGGWGHGKGKGDHRLRVPRVHQQGDCRVPFSLRATVKAHLNRIFKKFNTSSRSKLITLLLQQTREKTA